MSDLDDLEEILGPHPQRMRRRLRRRGELETYCRRGHELSPENVHLEQVSGGTIRHCKKCARLRILCREDS